MPWRQVSRCVANESSLLIVSLKSTYSLRMKLAAQRIWPKVLEEQIELDTTDGDLPSQRLVHMTPFTKFG